MKELPVNKILCGEAREVMSEWPEGEVDQFVTSPPFWAKRDYGAGTEAVWGGSPECDHEWVEHTVGLAHENRNMLRGSQEKVHQATGAAWIRKYDQLLAEGCSKCGAWRGQLGLEPHPGLYIEHIVEFARSVRRILKPRGTFWLNLGDTYCPVGKWGGEKGHSWGRGRDRDYNTYWHTKGLKDDGGWIQTKQKLLIPSRVAAALQDDGWIIRNDITWFKPNHMPESTGDRFTTTTEMIYVLAPGPHYDFYLDHVRLPHSPATLKDLARRRKKNYPELGPRPFSAQLSGRPRESFLHKKGKNPGDHWAIQVISSKVPHYATWPPELVRRMIKAGSKKGDLIVDPFNGVGTTTKVAKKLGRKFIGIDIKPEYCEIARQLLKAPYRDTDGIKRLTQ